MAMNKCGQCGAESADICNQNGCGFLESGNGAPCCVPTPEEEQLLASGDYRPEELWGGPRPTCPKCIGGKP